MRVFYPIFSVTLAFLFALFLCLPGHAKTVEYALTIAEQPIDITGEPVMGMTINGGIPGPTLYYTEGDNARITVHNSMDVSTSIHWHGLLVPPGMDGVPYISFPPIAPGETFVYEYPIRQSGTYWYHSHSNLQEQSGVYGSIVIYPREPDIKADKDYVVLLSDWTNQNPHQVMNTLKRGSEWFAIEKGSSQSIIGAMRAGKLNDYFMRELQRMPPMDISDVAYDRFLANGKPEIHLEAEADETLRLRIIDGSAMTFFYLEYAGGPMTIISADGQDVTPVNEQRFLISVAETYDVLIKVPKNGAYELRATAQDSSAFASVWIGQGEKHYAPAVPAPNLYEGMGKPTLDEILALTPSGSIGMTDAQVEAGEFDKPGMMGMHDMSNMEKPMGMSMGEHTMHMPSMKIPTFTPDVAQPGTGKKFAKDFRPLASDVSSTKLLAVDGGEQRPWPPYQQLRSTHNTAFSREQPVREIRLTLDGDMERYIWTLNNQILSETDTIKIQEGEIVRFIMINRTMMHHPMHLHGHFFRVINDQGDYSPLKHTVDVAPMSTTVIEFNANEVGDWFFHCHLLYHMKSGMARVVHYEEFTPPEDVQAVRNKLYVDPWYTYAQGGFYSNMTDGTLTVSNTRNMLTFDWEVGWQDVETSQTEIILTWDRYINRFFSFYFGGDFGNEVPNNRGILGLRYLLPLNFEYTMFIGTDGGGRFQVDKTFQLTPRLSLVGRSRFDTKTYWENEASLLYMLTQQLSAGVIINSDYGFGGGLELEF